MLVTLANSTRCICLPNLIVIDVMGMEILVRSYISSYLEKAEFTNSVCHIEKFSKSVIPIYNSEVPDTTGLKTRR